MKHDKELREYLGKYININKDRLENAKSKVSSNWALINYLEEHLESTFDWAYQWSFSYYTTIKPNPGIRDSKYDVDVAIKLPYRKDWQWKEKEYHNLIIKCLRGSDRYKNMLDISKERAIRINYSARDEEFHVDLVPMFNDWRNWNVIDRKRNVTEISWGSEFKDWVNEQNNKTSIEWSKAKFLKETIRIYKFLRDRHNPNVIRSVQLTLLLARQIDKLTRGDFLDLTSTFFWVSVKLREELILTNNISELDLSNPWLPKEVFNRKFTDVHFQEFKLWIIDIIDKIEEAYIEPNFNQSVSKWRKIFLDNFNPLSVNEISVRYIHAKNPSDLGWEYLHEVEKINIIWFKAPKRNKDNVTSFISNEKLPGDMILSFYAQIKREEQDYKLHWQVTNESNIYVQKLRWEIDSESISLWYSDIYWWYGIQETWLWKGKHWVKCFLVYKNKLIVWESDHFYVNII